MNSSFRRILFSVYIFLVFSSLRLAAQQSTPLFWIGGEAQSAEEFMYAYNKNRQAVSSQFSEADLEEYFDLYVNFKLKVKEARALGYHLSPAFNDEMATYRVQLAKPYLTEKIISNDLVDEAYKRTLEEVEASHILLELPPNASPADTLQAWKKLEEIKQRVARGEAFPKLARELSQDPSAKQNNGYLGFFGAFQMVYPFENAAFKTPVGQVSDPFRTSFGYHIVLVHSRRPAQGSFRLAHIFLKTQQADSALARKRAGEIIDRLKNGDDWIELARRYSDEATNKDKGGELPWLTLRQLPPAFASEIEKLAAPGAISQPVKSEAGWHIFKLLEKKPVPPLEEVRDMIEARISKDERSQKKNALAAEALIEKLGATVYDSTLQQAKRIEDGSLPDGKWTYDASQPFLKNKLLSSADTILTVEDFYTYVEQKQRKTTGMSSTSYADLLWHQFLFETLEDLEIRLLAKTNNSYRFLYREYYEGTLLFEIMNEKVWQFANKDTTGLASFFGKQRQRYQWDERAKATIVEGAPEVLQLISSASLAGQYLLHREVADQSGILHALNSVYAEVKNAGFAEDSLIFLIYGKEQNIKSALQAVSDSAKISIQIKDTTTENYTLELLTASESLLQKYFNAVDPLSLKATNGMYEKSEGVVPTRFWEKGFHLEITESFAKGYFVHDIIPAQSKSLSEVRGKVVSDYQEYLESEWVKSLKTKYPLKVNSKAWKNVVRTVQN